MKRKPEDLDKKAYKETLAAFDAAVSRARSRKELHTFLHNLLTESEQVMLGRRVQISQMLLRGKSHAEIGRKLKVGPNTVWRVELWLAEQFPEYESIQETARQAEDAEKAERAEMKRNPFGYAALKRKYPLYFLLFPKPKVRKK